MRYTKTESGLTNAQDIPKIKNFTCAEDVCNALSSNELKTGEIFSIPVVNGIFDDLSSDLAEIKSYIPNSTSVENRLTNVCQVQCMISEGTTDYNDCWARLCCVECCADVNHSNIVQIGSVIPSDATSVNQLTTVSTVNCATSALDCRITCLESCSGLDCVGTVTGATIGSSTAISPDANGNLDLTSLALNCDLTNLGNRVGCTESDITTLTCSLTTLNGTVTGHTTSIDTLNTCVSCLKSCDGLDCTGTLVASDLTSINTSITNLGTCTTNLGTAVNNLCSCAGLNCTGTLTSSDLTSINSDITALKSCPGLKCTGTSSATFSLSGTTLTITV